MSTIFSKIISGEIPAYKVAENDHFLAFLDVFPLRRGHTLVIPKKEVDYIFDMDDDLLADMMIFSKEVAKKLKSKIDCTKIGVAVIGLEVAHAHVHLVPINDVSDIDFSQEKLQLNSSEFEEILDTINK